MPNETITTPCPDCGHPVEWMNYYKRIVLTGKITCPCCKKSHDTHPINQNNVDAMNYLKQQKNAENNS